MIKNRQEAFGKVTDFFDVLADNSAHIEMKQRLICST